MKKFNTTALEKVGVRFADTLPCRKFGFTLAEVLITLGIIGVVAAVTMPTLIAKYQKHVTETRLKKSYSLINQAIKMSEIDNGLVKYWNKDLGENYGDNTQKFAEKYLLPYLKAEYCDSGNKSEKCGKYVGCGGASRNYILADGTLMSICAYGSFEAISINFLPIKSEKKERRFNFIIDEEKGLVLPSYYNPSLTRNDYINGFKYGDESYNYTVACSKESNADYPYHTCTSLIYVDGWKIMPDYPW